MIVHGSKESTIMLSDYFRNSESLSIQVFSPELDECVSVSFAKNMYQVVLTDALVSSLRLSQVFFTNIA